jgi:hypothetical protein
VRILGRMTKYLQEVCSEVGEERALVKTAKTGTAPAIGK